MPASTTGSRTGAGAEAGGSAGLGATGAVAAGAVGRPEMTGLGGRGAAGNPAARAGLATPGKAEDKLRMGEHETICLLREAPFNKSPPLFGHCPFGGGSKPLPGWVGALF